MYPRFGHLTPAPLDLPATPLDGRDWAAAATEHPTLPLAGFVYRRKALDLTQGDAPTSRQVRILRRILTARDELARAGWAAPKVAARIISHGPWRTSVIFQSVTDEHVLAIAIELDRRGNIIPSPDAFYPHVMLIDPDGTRHMYGLRVYVEDGLTFALQRALLEPLAEQVWAKMHQPGQVTRVETYDLSPYPKMVVNLDLGASGSAPTITVTVDVHRARVTGLAERVGRTWLPAEGIYGEQLRARLDEHFGGVDLDEVFGTYVQALVREVNQVLGFPAP